MRCALPTLALAIVLLGCSSSSGAAGPGGSSDAGGSDAPSSQDDAAAGDASSGQDVTTEAGPEDSAAGEGSSPLDSGVAIEAGAGEAGVMQTVEMTFYGWADNSPPGASIAYPKNGGFPTVHDLAGGTGTYADPITYASDKSELPVGTIVYAPVIEKYLVMEDDCGQCDTDWSGSMMWHIDVWMNSNGTEMTNALVACEDQWTQNTTTIEIDPPPWRTVTTAPLFDPSTNTCRTTP